ncbi:MAG: tRNA (adenosine(37)-N6)-threonylcarbamoyltransferase complex dimerization subunit type 1 TsaB [Pseudomonadota bacterium]|nr:tRNA (adenosine(37)-N6)-threonylcarbamoyltransferase complex dimerization subunit type 1 TsaB [Pseudomonadota bacterium]
MILAIDSASAACTAALLTIDGGVIAERHEEIGRGHAERLMPMVADLLGAHIPAQILVGVGPGSFTGLRVAIGAAHGMAIGWSVPVCGFDSLALVAASVPSDAARDDGAIGVAMLGGHGEWFVAQYDRRTFALAARVASMTPDDAARAITAPTVVGSAAEALVARRGSGAAIATLPHAARALALPLALRSLDPKPVYARAPDAKPAVAA